MTRGYSNTVDVTPMAAVAVNQPSTVAVDFSVLDSPYYTLLDDDAQMTHRQVSVVQTVSLRMPAGVRNVSMAPTLLPFGLLETITVSSTPTDCKYKLQIHKIPTFVPDSDQMIIWKIIILLLLFYYLFMLPIIVAFRLEIENKLHLFIY